MEPYWEVVEPLFSIIEFGEGPSSFAKSVGSTPHASVILFAAHMCLAEVHNGGFLQLFWNNTGLLVPEGVEGFSAVGMPQMSAILSSAARPLGTPYPRDRDDRWDAMLAASGRNESELTQIFEKYKSEPNETKGLYAAFAEATANLGFDELDEQFWKTAKTENGGFQDAATRFASS
jgi:hypothetical protein